MFTQPTAANATGGEDDGDDMFADEDEDAPAVAVGTLSDAPKPGQQSGGGEDYCKWSISDLKRLLVERGGDASGITEKGELVERVREAMKTPAAAATTTVPQGYVYDTGSGYYYNHSTQLYFDPQSGYFYNGSEWIPKPT